MMAIAIILGLGWLTVFYGSFIEPKILVVRESAIELSSEPTEQLRVAVVADFHVGPYKGERWVRQVVDRVMALEADLIIMPGDFIFRIKDEVEMLAPIKDLSAPFGVWAVTGNHDYEDDASRVVVETLESYGVVVLENERERIAVGESEVVIAGVSDIWYEGDVERTLVGLEGEEVVLLISHNPDAVLHKTADRADLVIAGHTHGGQIRLPVIGAVPQIPTELGNAFDKGLFSYNDQQLFITSGVGETGPRARLFNPPEINLLTISL